jgi:hypothetical protein
MRSLVLDHTVWCYARIFHRGNVQDGFSNPFYSSAAPSSRVLLQVKRTKAADGRYTFHVSAVARIPTTHEFSGLADFQVLFVDVVASVCHFSMVTDMMVMVTMCHLVALAIV